MQVDFLDMLNNFWLDFNLTIQLLYRYMTNTFIDFNIFKLRISVKRWTYISKGCTYVQLWYNYKPGSYKLLWWL